MIYVVGSVVFDPVKFCQHYGKHKTACEALCDE